MTMLYEIMKKENRDIKVQIRITNAEKVLLDKLVETNRELTISRIFRDSIHENCEKFGIKEDAGVGNFTIG